MPPKRKTKTKKKYVINVRIDVPGNVVDAARALPAKECDAAMAAYLKKNHNVDAKKLHWGGGSAPTSAAPKKKSAAARPAAAASAPPAAPPNALEGLSDDSF